MEPARVYAVVRDVGRQPQRRLADLMIAAVAVANDLPLVTRNAADFTGLADLVDIVEV